MSPDHRDHRIVLLDALNVHFAHGAINPTFVNSLCKYSANFSASPGVVLIKMLLEIIILIGKLIFSCAFRHFERDQGLSDVTRLDYEGL